MMSVDEKTKDQLRVLILQAPTPALAALTPEASGARLKLYLTEVFLVGRRGVQ
jgi:hypothetical protein